MKKELYKIENFLLHLSPEFVDYNSINEKEVIKNFVNNFDSDSMIWTLEEGQEVLGMDPFPWEWVCDIRGFYSCVPETRMLIEDPKFYHDWLLTTLIMLQEEAIKVGKLDKPVLLEK